MEKINTLQLSFKCHKAFNELQPCNGNWYCNGCQKIVHDFRGMKEGRIKNIFAQHGGNICGMFEADRINAPLPKWRKLLSAVVIALGFTGLHQTLYAQAPDKTASKDSVTNIAKQDAVFGAVESSAEFPGGIEAFYKFISTYIVPDTSCRPGEKAFFTFIVETNGSLSDISILRSSFSRQMNEQIIGMFKNSPRWKPGTQNGQIVRQQYTVPVMPVPIAK